MKKIILAIVLAVGVLYTMAQDEVLQLYIAQKKWDDAKTEVDKMVANPKLKDKEKATAYLWKLTVYSQLYNDPALSAKYPDANEQALDAFNQYAAMDPSLKQLKEQNFAVGIGNLYSGSFEKGKTYFQNKDWENAYKYFSEAERMGDFLLTNKLSATTATVDTITVLYTGYSAQNAQHQDTAVKYYSKLADIKISGPDYEDIYKYLVQYYSDKKDDANFKKYLALAKELYPNDNSMWTQFEMSNMTANANLMDLLQKYQQDYAAGGMNEDKYIGYAEAFATTDKTQLEKLDSLQKLSLKMAAAQGFSKAFELNNSNGLYAFNTGVIYYSTYGELDDRYSAYRGEGATLKAKRAEIAKQEMAYADTAAQWLEKAYTILKAKQDRTRNETTSLNRTVDYLANIYIWERDQTKTNGNPKDYDKYDALYKKYDAEHNMYK
jgi:hypothetical protein